MIKHILLCTALTLTIPLWATAACENNSETVFSCLTAKGKRIQVCDSGETIDYSYGRPGSAPEIVVRAPRCEASTFQWQGIGRYISYVVDIPNDNTNYSVFWGADRLTEGHPIEAGVHVLIDGKDVVTVLCVDEDNIIQNIEGMNLKPME